MPAEVLRTLAMTSRKLERFAPEIEQEFARKAKIELRKSVLRIRSATPRATREAASDAVRKRVHELLGALPREAIVASFWSILHKGEIDTSGIDADARALGLRVAYPFLEDDDAPGRPPTMTFRLVASTDALGERGHGFAEPPPEAPLADDAAVALVLVPGLAFDPYGRRLGYGAGYYDRTLARLTRAERVAIGFDFQLLVDLPHEPWDLPMHRIVTDKRALRVEDAAREEGTR